MFPFGIIAIISVIYSTLMQKIVPIYCLFIFTAGCCTVVSFGCIMNSILIRVECYRSVHCTWQSCSHRKSKHSCDRPTETGGLFLYITDRHTWRHILIVTPLFFYNKIITSRVTFSFKMFVLYFFSITSISVLCCYLCCYCGKLRLLSTMRMNAMKRKSL